MNLNSDPQAQLMVITVVGLLALASVIGWLLAKNVADPSKKEVVNNLNARIRAWWAMVITFIAATTIGKLGSLLLFSLISFLALREFITITPTRCGDHKALFWTFFVIMPINYYLLAINWLALYLIFIPVYAYLLIPISNAIAGDTKDFLGRTSKIQWALMICVYFVSYAPALLDLQAPSQAAKLLWFFVFIVQISDVCQYIFGKLFGKHKLTQVSPNKTLEGFLGGVFSAVALGAWLHWLTPFNPWQAALMALVISLMGCAGGLVMSAIKRERGVKDYGAILAGHGGMMDRIDSLCFAAPIFYHLTRYFFLR
jgi:phosphatidate cytidylyltransferase